MESCAQVVVLVESNALGSGSTGKAAGGIRMRHGDPLNTGLAWRSVTEFSRFAELTGTDAGFKQVGYLVPSTTSVTTSCSPRLPRRSALGIPVELLTPDAAGARVPQLDVNGLVGATYCPWDGTRRPSRWGRVGRRRAAARGAGAAGNSRRPVSGAGSSIPRSTAGSQMACPADRRLRLRALLPPTGPRGTSPASTTPPASPNTASCSPALGEHVAQLITGQPPRTHRHLKSETKDRDARTTR